MTDKIAIALCFDSNYADYAAVATYSAFQNAQSDLVVYWLVPHECIDEARQRLVSLKDIEPAATPPGSSWPTRPPSPTGKR